MGFSEKLSFTESFVKLSGEFVIWVLNCPTIWMIVMGWSDGRIEKSDANNPHKQYGISWYHKEKQEPYRTQGHKSCKNFIFFIEMWL